MVVRLPNMRPVGCAPKTDERICQLAEQFPKSRSSVSSNATLHVYFHDASPAKKTTSDPSQNSAINATLYVNQFTYMWSRPKNSNSTHSGWLNSCVQSKTVSSEQEHTQCNLKSRTLLDVHTQIQVQVEQKCDWKCTVIFYMKILLLPMQQTLTQVSGRRPSTRVCPSSTQNSMFCGSELIYFVVNK